MSAVRRSRRKPEVSVVVGAAFGARRVGVYRSAYVPSRSPPSSMWSSTRNDRQYSSRRPMLPAWMRSSLWIVVRSRQPPRAFSSSCSRTAKREVEDFDRQPTVEWLEPSADARRGCRARRARPAGAMGDLLMSMEDRSLVARMRRGAKSNGHALGEESAVVRPGGKCRQPAAHDAEALGYRREHLRAATQLAATRTRRIAVEHPVRPELGGREAGHAGQPYVLSHSRPLRIRRGARRARAARRSVVRPSTRCPWRREVDARARWNAICASTMSASSRASTCHDQLHLGSA